MKAILLHKPGKRTGDITKGLLAEGIRINRQSWNPKRDLHHKILDVNVILIHCDSPDRDILALIPLLRRKKYLIPIAVIDETENAETKRCALEWSADEYFSKPVSYRLLAMRLKNIVCHKENLARSSWLRAFNIWLDTEHRFVKRDNQVIPLRNKEFLLLEYFILNRGKLITRNSLLENVWDRNAEFSSNTIDVHINRLRLKIDRPFREKFIHTVPCMGYIFEKRPNGKNKLY